MEYRQLGRSGLMVAKVCMGTMTFDREADVEMSYKLLDRYVEIGGNFVDTADIYSDGASEVVVGNWLKMRSNRRDTILATKVFGEMGTGPNDKSLSRFHIQHAVEDSLRRLQTDVIDLYIIHRWDYCVPVEETVRALDDLVRSGKVRYLGCSNLKAWQLSKFLYTARMAGMDEFISVQPVYNALNRGIESELLELVEDQGLGVVPYNPLAGGMLTGKYLKGLEGLPENARMKAFAGYFDRYHTGEALHVVQSFVDAAAERGVSPAALALAWVLNEPRITSPLLGARNLDQLNDTLTGLDLTLTAEEREAIPSVRTGRWVGECPVYDRNG